MGKLHTLRRAILRDPARWTDPRYGSTRHRYAAAYWDGKRKQWMPSFGWWGKARYMSFVRYTLTGVGNAEGGQGAERK